MTDKLRIAAQQALEALYMLTDDYDDDVVGLEIDAIAALSAALAEQPAESLDGKLVMGLAVIRELTGTQKTDNIEATIEAVRKAVAPQPAKQPLTDDELTAIIREASKGSALRPMDKQPTSLRIARAIERAHGIGGGV